MSGYWSEGFGSSLAEMVTQEAYFWRTSKSGNKLIISTFKGGISSPLDESIHHHCQSIPISEGFTFFQLIILCQ
jgi:hypothetical protein